MREILFRGKILETEFQNVSHSWGKQNGDWVDGFYHVRTECVCGGYEYCECDGFDQHLISVKGEDDYPIDPETVGQYTGLTDKNGKKIFEGDIVRHEAFGNRAVVWGCKYLEMTTTGWWLCKTIVPLSSDIKSLESKNSEIEVIGNIHDNPELLEV